MTDNELDWSDMTDEDLRLGLATILLSVTDPRCEVEIRDDLMDFGQEIRDELKRRIEAREKDKV